MVKDDALSNAECYIVEIIHSVPLRTGIPIIGLAFLQALGEARKPGSNPWEHQAVE